MTQFFDCKRQTCPMSKILKGNGNNLKRNPTETPPCRYAGSEYQQITNGRASRSTRQDASGCRSVRRYEDPRRSCQSDSERSGINGYGRGNSRKNDCSGNENSRENTVSGSEPFMLHLRIRASTLSIPAWLVLGICVYTVQTNTIFIAGQYVVFHPFYTEQVVIRI